MDYVFMIWEWETTWVGLDLIHVSSTYWSMYANLYTNFDDKLDFELSASQDFQNIKMYVIYSPIKHSKPVWHFYVYVTKVIR